MKDKDIFYCAQKYSLQDLFCYLLKKNGGALNGYHNTGHCLVVFSNVISIVENESLSPRLSGAEVRSLGAAALFHDFNHGGGRYQPDDYNITLATTALAHAQQEVRNPLSREELSHATALIECTHFPYREEPRDVCERILRDADLLPSLDGGGYIQQVLMGLHAELGKKNTLIEFIEGQITFLKGIKWHTGYGHMMARELLSGRLAFLKDLVTTLEISEREY